MGPVICVECWEFIETDNDLTWHSIQHQAGTEGLAIAACPRCYGPKGSNQGHPPHVGRCNLPTGHLGVVSCYCTHKTPSQVSDQGVPSVQAQEGT